MEALVHAETTNRLRSAALLAGLLLVATPGLAQNTEADDPLAERRAAVAGRGPHAVSRLVEADGLRDGPDYRGATVYYPTDLEGPLTGMVIVPGFRAPESSVGRWGPYLASHGIVTMTIGTNRRGDMPEDRADALLDAVKTLEAENEREGSPLAGRLDVERIGVGGWSMGGGGAQLAAVRNPELDAVLALCPWKPGHAFEHPVPVMILSGENDRPAPPSMHADVHYRSTPKETPRLLFEVAEGNHYLPWNPANSDGAVGRVALLWLKVHLEDDDAWRPLLRERPKTASRYEFELGPESTAPPETGKDGK